MPAGPVSEGSEPLSSVCLCPGIILCFVESRSCIVLTPDSHLGPDELVTLWATALPQDRSPWQQHQLFSSSQEPIPLTEARSIIFLVLQMRRLSQITSFPRFTQLQSQLIPGSAAWVPGSFCCLTHTSPHQRIQIPLGVI